MNRVDDTSVYSVSNRFDIRIMISYKQMMANSVTALYKLWVTAVMKESSSDFEAAPFWQVATCMYTCHELLWRCQKCSTPKPQATVLRQLHEHVRYELRAARTQRLRTVHSTPNHVRQYDTVSRNFEIIPRLSVFQPTFARRLRLSQITLAVPTSAIIRRHFSLQPSVGWHNK